MSLLLTYPKTVKDFVSDVSDLTDAARVKVYMTLMDKMIDTLKHNGIEAEER